MTTLILGRATMGEHATEKDFETWIGFVVSRIDAATGLDVEV